MVGDKLYIAFIAILYIGHEGRRDQDLARKIPGINEDAQIIYRP